MYDHDHYGTVRGDLVITPIFHASVVMRWDGKTIFVDPVGDPDRYASFPAPDLIVITHHHGDHLDLDTLAAVSAPTTECVAPPIVYDQMPTDLAKRTRTMKNGDEATVQGITISAIPMYNTTPDRQKYHEKGVGNGYLFDFAGTRIYLASDTEPTPEMDTLGPVEVALFPMNLPFTMTPDQVVTCIEKTRPRYTYICHYRYPFDKPGTEPETVLDLLPPQSQTKLVLRDWYKGV